MKDLGFILNSSLGPEIQSQCCFCQPSASQVHMGDTDNSLPCLYNSTTKLHNVDDNFIIQFNAHVKVSKYVCSVYSCSRMLAHV